MVLGVVLTFSAVLLVSQNQELLLRLPPLLARPSAAGLSARLAVAYPVARRFRTGATLSMYGLVVFTLVLISVLGTVIDAGVDRAVATASGGYALRVDWNPQAPVADPAARLAGGRFAGRVAGVAPLETAEAEVTGVPGAAKAVPATAVGAGAALADHGLFPSTPGWTASATTGRCGAPSWPTRATWSSTSTWATRSRAWTTTPGSRATP